MIMYKEFCVAIFPEVEIGFDESGAETNGQSDDAVQPYKAAEQQQVDWKVSNASPGRERTEVDAWNAPATSSPRGSSSKPMIKPPSRPRSAEIDARLAAVERAVARQEGVEAALLQTQKQQVELQATMTELLAELRKK